jgi:GT2 family glycosyltransferase
LQPPIQVPKATLSIVSHGHGPMIRRLLLDLDAAAASSIERAIVTFNVPEPDVVKDLRELDFHFPVDIVLNETPIGFGANHNAAFRRNTSDWFLVLNPDVRTTGDPITPLWQKAEPRTAVLAPRIMEPGKGKPEPHRKLLTPLEIVLRTARIPNESPRIEWVAGMFMLFRAEAFRSVGGFDERYFMYVEDADICARLKLAGWALTIDDAVRVVHEAQRASRRHFPALSWHMKSLVRWWLSAAFWRTLVRRRPPSSR